MDTYDPNIAAIAANLDSLKDVTKDGFAKVENRLGRLESDISNLRDQNQHVNEWRGAQDEWRRSVDEERKETREYIRNQERQSVDWSKIVLGLISLVALALGVGGPPGTW